VTLPLACHDTRVHTCVMTPNENHTPRRTIRMDDDLWQMVTDYATAVGESASSVIRAAIYSYTVDFPMSDAAAAVSDKTSRGDESIQIDENRSK